jgi:hypothetical protein
LVSPAVTHFLSSSFFCFLCRRHDDGSPCVGLRLGAGGQGCWP